MAMSQPWGHLRPAKSRIPQVWNKVYFWIYLFKPPEFTSPVEELGIASLLRLC